MPVNAEKEITKLWKSLQAAQKEIHQTYYRWREFALELAGDGADPTETALKAADAFGRYIGKGLLPRLNLLKGDEGFMGMLGKQLAGLWAVEGAVVNVEKGETPLEVILRCTRDPWPTAAKEFAVPMEEVALARERLFQAMLVDISVFFNRPLKIEMQKAIPRGEGEWVFRLWMDK
ncbi:MAG: hypothetical protein ACLFUE_09460 [Desulfobacteraceae bacterium]